MIQAPSGRGRRAWQLHTLCLACFCVATGVQALPLETGNPDLSLSVNTTLKGSSAWRLKNPSAALTDPSANSANVNQNDGDNNFRRGLISQRLDIYSELDASYGSWSVRLSGAGWYDLVYNRGHDNDGSERVNSGSVLANQFTAATREQHGRDAELLDAFVSTRFRVFDRPVSVRFGRHALLWGESLFFGSNGVAGAMAPMDLVKLLSVPGTPFKEVIRPEAQVSGQVQFNADWSLAAFIKGEWTRSRVAAAGSYFSFSDTVDAGAERMLIGAPGNYLARGVDMKARDGGEGGVNLKWRPQDTELDLALSLLQFHNRTPNLYLRFLGNPAATPPNSGAIGQFQLAFAEKIRMLGLSASTTFERVNVGAELSMRSNAPLTAGARVIPAVPGVVVDNADNALYPVGQTAHAQVSWLASMPRLPWAPASEFLGEIAWNRALSVSRNPAAVSPTTSRDALAFRLQYAPTYRQVLAGLDLSVPIGLSYAPMGRSRAVSNFAVHKGGDISVGLVGSYLDVWRFGLNLVHYYGPAGGYLDTTNNLSFQQALRDRDFVSLSLSRTF